MLRGLFAFFGLGLKMHYESGMHTFPFKKTLFTTTLLLASPWIAAIHGQSKTTQKKADNTAVNERDRSPAESTADQQKMNAADTDLTAKIRRAIMADKSLSTYAHNVKIISQDGTVTLKGPVRTEAEVKSIVSKATAVTGKAERVVNQLAVEPVSKP